MPVVHDKYDYFLSIMLVTALLLATYLPVLFGYTGSDTTNIILSLFSVYIFLLLLFYKSIRISVLDFGMISISLVSSIYSKNMSLIAPAIMIILMIYFSSIQTYDLMKYYFVLMFLMIFIIIFSYFIFNKTQNDFSMWRINQIIDRKALGFSHPNQAMVAWLGLCITFILIIKKNYARNLLYMIIVSTFLYRMTRSRTEFLVILLIAILVFLMRKKLNTNVNGYFKFILGVTPVVLLFVGFLLMNLSDNTVINNYLSGRPVLYRQYYDTSGITLFGNSVLEEAMFDNSYLQMLLSKGIITVFVYDIMIFEFVKKNEITYKSFILMESLFMCAITETILFKFELFVPIIIYVSQNYKGRIEEE